jgi:hypothetical protein
VQQVPYGTPREGCRGSLLLFCPPAGNPAPLACNLRQASVDTHVTNFLSNAYWIGVVKVGLQGQWALMDGTLVGNGVPSNDGPYAHWWVLP